MATGPAEPFTGEEIDFEADTRGAEHESELEFDPSQLAVKPGSDGWRVRHLMFIVIVVAVLLWVLLLVGSVLLVGGLVALVAAVIGGAVVLCGDGRAAKIRSCA